MSSSLYNFNCLPPYDIWINKKVANKYLIKHNYLRFYLDAINPWRREKTTKILIWIPEIKYIFLTNKDGKPETEKNVKFKPRKS